MNLSDGEVSIKMDAFLVITFITFIITLLKVCKNDFFENGDHYLLILC